MKGPAWYQRRTSYGTVFAANPYTAIHFLERYYGQRYESKPNLEIAYNRGTLIANEIICSELSPQFTEKEMLDDALRQLSMRTVSLDLGVACHAG